jgi:uncharacterized protein YcfJ
MIIGRIGVALALSLWLSLIAPAAMADTPAFDTATVLDVQPVLSRVAVESTRQDCVPATRDSRDLQSLYPGLAAAIEGEHARQVEPACRSVRMTDFREEVSGYRVRYRYGAGEYERVMSYDPGPTLRVRVQVRPGP